MCGDLADGLLAIATDPENHRFARAYAAERAKLDAAQRKAALADGEPSFLPAFPDGRDPNVLCGRHPRFVAATKAMAKLLLVAFPPPT